MYKRQVLKGDKLWISAANPAVNKYGDWPSAVYGIFIIGPGLRYAMRVDPNNKDNKTRMLTKRFIIIWHPQIFLIPFVLSGYIHYLDDH